MGGFLGQVIKEMKSHPITLTLVIIGMAGIVFGYTNFARAAEVDALKASITQQTKINTCRWLSDNISKLETDIYVLERDQADARWVNQKKSELNKLRERYRATTCSKTGY